MQPGQIYSHVGEVPLALAVFLASDYYDHNHDPLTISATTLLKPLRQIILAARVPPEKALVPLPDMVKNRIGAAIHDGIERAWTTNHVAAMKAMGYPQHVIDRVVVNPTPQWLALNQGGNWIPVYLEQRLSRKFGKWTVTGKYDFVGEGRVQDFKSTTVWTYQNQVNNNKYAMQGSIYRCLDSGLITQSEMDIHFIFTDWSASKARIDATGYPQRAFLKQVFSLRSIPETERFIHNKLALLEKFWDAPEKDIPDCDDEDLWRSDPTWKYYANPEKTQRATRNFPNDKAGAYAYWAEKGGKGFVKEVPGEVTACKYCPAYVMCGQKDRLITAGELNIGL